MNSFNVYGQNEKKVGGNTPVWLGTVKPVPVGAVIDDAYPGDTYRAGMLVEYHPATKTISQTFDVLGDLENANAFLYNDVFLESVENDDLAHINATCAVVMHHPEGLLIERVYPEITEEQIHQIQSQIPGVLLVRG